MKKTKAKPVTNLGVVQDSKGYLTAPTPKGPNPALLPSIIIEPTEEERLVLVRMVERIRPPVVRTVLEIYLLKKATAKRKSEMKLSGAERFAIRHYIEKIPHKRRTEAETTLREKVA